MVLRGAGEVAKRELRAAVLPCRRMPTRLRARRGMGYLLHAVAQSCWAVKIWSRILHTVAGSPAAEADQLYTLRPLAVSSPHDGMQVTSLPSTFLIRHS